MKTFKRQLFFLLIIISSVGIFACQKGGGGTETGEASLVVTTNPLANGHVEAPAPGPDFVVTVNITSAMPSAGVKIDVSAKPDGGSVNFFTNSRTTTTASNNFTITGTPSGALSSVTIVVTSVSTPTNTFTGSYKYSRK